VYLEFKNTQNADFHILFTARPPYRESQNSFSEDLTKIATLELNAFDDVDDLINKFAERHDSSFFSHNVCEKIKKVSKGSLWLLSYALKGCIKAQCKGEPHEWVREEVKKDLRNLGVQCAVFPKVLVALSPLYMNEILTVQFFLTGHLGYEEEILRDLAKMGEITRQETREGECMYGLPHSALAEAYWRHGLEHRGKLLDYRDFVYDYVSFGVPNGLEAINSSIDWGAKIGYQAVLADRLGVEGKVAMVINRNESNRPFYQFITRWMRPIDLVTDEVLAALAIRVQAMDNFDEQYSFLDKVYYVTHTNHHCLLSGRCQESTTRIWKFLDIKTLVSFMGQLKTHWDFKRWMCNIIEGTPEVALVVLRLLNAQELMDKWAQEDEINCRELYIHSDAPLDSHLRGKIKTGLERFGMSFRQG